jgi:hypothetical protein
LGSGLSGEGSEYTSKIVPIFLVFQFSKQIYVMFSFRH